MPGEDCEEGTLRPGSHLGMGRTLAHMTLEGNSIRCDRNGCRTEDSFEGELSPEETLIRFHVLGWRFTEDDSREFHHCPIHF